MSILRDVTVVLVEPLYGGNVGSAARVMANFGLDRLVLVRPAEGIFEDPSLEPMARDAALPIVRGARVTDSLAEALADTEIALGFTTRLGKRRRDGYDLRPAVGALALDFPAARVAAVFGSENKGLSTADLDLCHWLVRIPTEQGFTSLNLAQAVGLFAYELRAVRRAEGAGRPQSRGVATVSQMEGFYGHLERVLLKIGFIEEASPARMMNQFRRMFGRRLPDPRDVRILRGVLSKVEGAIDRGRRK
jgi:TrmH family RNA methyltransferase